MKETGPNLIKKVLFCTILLKTDDLNAENSTKIYLDKINMLLDTYAPLQRINKYKLKFKFKPWITLDLKNQYL